MAEITYGEIYVEFCNWNQEIGAKTIDYKPWGSTSIVIWLDNGLIYKVKRIDANHFIMQPVSKADIEKKYG